MKKSHENVSTNEISFRRKNVSHIQCQKNWPDRISLDLAFNSFDSVEQLISQLSQIEKKLISLNLMHNQIQNDSCINSKLNTFSSLQILNIQGNFLTSIPKNLPLCLKSLNLSRNRIETVDHLKLLQHLEHLDLSHNLLCELDGVLCLPKLKILDLSRNKLNSLRNLSRWKLVELEELVMSHTEITNVSQITSKAFPKLRILKLDYNKIKNLASFSSMPNLTDLHLNDNQMSSLFVSGGKQTTNKGIGKLFPGIDTLYLNNNQIDDPLEDIITALFEMKNLIVLKIKENPFTRELDNSTKHQKEKTNVISYQLEIAKKLQSLHILDSIEIPRSINGANKTERASREKQEDSIVDASRMEQNLQQNHFEDRLKRKEAEEVEKLYRNFVIQNNSIKRKADGIISKLQRYLETGLLGGTESISKDIENEKFGEETEFFSDDDVEANLTKTLSPKSYKSFLETTTKPKNVKIQRLSEAKKFALQNYTGKDSMDIEEYNESSMNEQCKKLLNIITADKKKPIGQILTPR